MTLREVLTGSIEFSDNGDDLYARTSQCSAIVGLDNHKAILAHFHPYNQASLCVDDYLKFLDHYGFNPSLIPHFVFVGFDFFNSGCAIYAKFFGLALYQEFRNRNYQVYMFESLPKHTDPDDVHHSMVDFEPIYFEPNLVIVSPRINKVCLFRAKDLEYLLSLSLTSPTEYELQLRNHAVL